MPAAKTKTTVEDEVQAALAWLKQKSTPRDRANLTRFGITATKAFGVSMANIQALAKRLGRNHELAAGHDKTAGDEPFVRSLPLIERAATDERNFVKKGASWALRRIGTRNGKLRAAALRVARRLADSPEAAARWVGKDALRDLIKSAP